MALKRAGASYSALRAATRLPPVERPVEETAEIPEVAPARAPAARIDTPDPAAAGQGPSNEATPETSAPEVPGKAAAKPIYYRLRVPYPAPGVCAEFDEIARAYDAEAAIQTVFKRAFDAWVERFGPETAARMDTDYPRGSKNFATSRIIDPGIVSAVERAIDPMGIRTKTFIAERIALAAMKAYIVTRGG